MKIKQKVVLIGCGLMGRKRALAIARHARSELMLSCDVNGHSARKMAALFGGGWTTNWKKAVCSQNSNIVVISTPNAMLYPIARKALMNGKAVFLEKPMAARLRHALELKSLAKKFQLPLRVGYNHRYHPALQRARYLVRQGSIGRILNLRALYGHGGRPGYNKEWRCDVRVSGGGEMLDQGVHLLDLAQWFCGRPHAVYGQTQRAVWQAKGIEDNAFALLKYPNQVNALIHCSWTQWKNLFHFEIFGDQGSILIQGLGGSYGPEKLILTGRAQRGGVPVQREFKFLGADVSWDKEWNDFVNKLGDKQRNMEQLEDAAHVFKTVEAIYRSNRTGRSVKIK